MMVHGAGLRLSAAHREEAAAGAQGRTRGERSRGLLQDDAGAFGDESATTDFSASNIDFLLEKNLADGSVATLEAALYDYDEFGAASKEGDATMVSLAYMPDGVFGLGRLQVSVRYQEFSPDDNLLARFFFVTDPDGYEIEVLQRHDHYH